jgi:hypothetical protein
MITDFSGTRQMSEKFTILIISTGECFDDYTYRRLIYFRIDEIGPILSWVFAKCFPNGYYIAHTKLEACL